MNVCLHVFFEGCFIDVCFFSALLKFKCRKCIFVYILLHSNSWWWGVSGHTLRKLLVKRFLWKSLSKQFHLYSYTQIFKIQTKETKPHKTMEYLNANLLTVAFIYWFRNENTATETKIHTEHNAKNNKERIDECVQKDTR